MKKLRDLAIGFLAVNLLWQICAMLLGLRVLPSPLTVYANFGRVIEGQVWLHILASLGRITAGLVLSMLLGIPLGILMGRSKRWNSILNPLLYFLYPVPKTALLPTLMLLFGLGNVSKVLLMVLTILFPTIVAVRDASGNILPEVYRVAKSAALKKGYVLRHVTLPAILPALFTSMRISMGTALAILFIAEAYGTRVGIGYYILDAWSRIDYIEMYGGIILISLTGAALFWVMDVVAKRVCHRTN